MVSSIVSFVIAVSTELARDSGERGEAGEDGEETSRCGCDIVSIFLVWLSLRGVENVSSARSEVKDGILYGVEL